MIIDKNIEILMLNEKHWISSSQEHQHMTFLTKDEHRKEECFENENGEVYLTQDVYSNSFDINKNLKQVIFVIGLNSLEEIEQIYRNKHKESIVIVIEPNLSLFNYVLNAKNMRLFKQQQIYLYANDDRESLTPFLRSILLDFKLITILKNTEIYVTDFYRKYEFESSKKFVNKIKEVIRNIMLSFGNDIKDGLIGLENNLGNLKYITESRNPARLRDSYKGKPAIVVAAGPSLNKNFDELKAIYGKAVIIAVDTIVERLVDNGVIPDFVCSVERGYETYKYFYKDKNIPQTVTLAGPLLLDKKIFETFKGELLIPFRTEVMEYRWLQSKLEITDSVGMLMGMSCAHVAFGMAHLLGCSPITLVGQDLAYGEVEGQTHAVGTLYDDESKKLKYRKDDSFTEGYYGETVRTSRMWSMFKYWYENSILGLNLDVINATEGGVKIANTRQMPLSEVRVTYCTESIEPVYEKIKQLDKYEINLEKAIENFKFEIDAFESFNQQCLSMIYLLRELEISKKNVNKKKKMLLQSLSVTDALVNRLMKHPLLMHNLQATIVIYKWNINSVTDEYNLENFQLKRKYQLKVLEPIVGTISEVIDYLKNAIEELEKEITKSK